MQRTSLWTYFKRGLTGEIVSLLVSFFVTPALLVLFAVSVPMALLAVIILIPVALIFGGWLMTQIVHKIT